MVNPKEAGGGFLQGDLVFAGKGRTALQEIQVATALAALFYIGLVVLPFWWRFYSDRKKKSQKALRASLNAEDGEDGEDGDEGEYGDDGEAGRMGGGGGGMGMGMGGGMGMWMGMDGGMDGSGGMEESSASMMPGQFPGPMPPPYPPAPAIRWAQELNDDRSPWKHPNIVFAGPRRNLRRMDLDEIEIGDMAPGPPQGGFYRYPGMGWPGMQHTPQGIRPDDGYEGQEMQGSMGKKVVMDRIMTLQRGFCMIMLWFLIPLLLATILTVLLAGFRGIRNISGRKAIDIEGIPIVRQFSGKFDVSSLTARFNTAEELSECQNDGGCNAADSGESCQAGSFISLQSAQNTFECLANATQLDRESRLQGASFFLNDCLRKNTGNAVGFAAFVRTCSGIGAGTGEVYALSVLFLVLVWIIITADFIGFFFNTSIAPIILFWFGWIVAIAALIISSIGITKVGGGDTIELLFSIGTQVLPPGTNEQGKIYVGAYESSRAILAPILILFFLQVIGTTLIYRPYKIYKGYNLRDLTVTTYIMDPLGASWAHMRKASKKKERERSDTDEISSGPERGVVGVDQGGMGQDSMYGGG